MTKSDAPKRGGGLLETGVLGGGGEGGSIELLRYSTTI